MEGKQYNAFSDELKRVFGRRVHRIPVDAGFTCPNRDGRAATGGCIYCGEGGSGSAGIAREFSISVQIEDGKKVIARRYRADRFIAYFQAFSNTYGPAERLRALYDEALSVKDVEGLIIGTRPDCLPPEILRLLDEYSKKTYLWLELGLQSTRDRTLAFINRGHDFATFTDAVKRCRERGIRVCAHIILGLPGEGREEMLSTTEVLNSLGINGVKIHVLHVIKGTRLADLYERGETRVMERDEYVGLVCDFLERLSPGIVIHRLTGECERSRLIAPLWVTGKFEVLNAIDDELRRRGSFQGYRAPYNNNFNSLSPNFFAASGPEPVISLPSTSTSFPV